MLFHITHILSIGNIYTYFRYILIGYIYLFNILYIYIYYRLTPKISIQYKIWDSKSPHWLWFRRWTTNIDSSLITTYCISLNLYVLANREIIYLCVVFDLFSLYFWKQNIFKTNCFTFFADSTILGFGV